MTHPRIERSHRISHDIRTPLTVIKEYASILREQLVGDLNSRQQDMLEVIDDRADEIHQFVENMLLLEPTNPRLGQADRRPLDLSQLCERIAAPFQRRADRNGLQFSLEIDPALPQVFADEALVELFLRNLFSLALRQRARGDSARVTITNADRHVCLKTVVMLDADGQGSQPLADQLGIGAETSQRLVEANLGRLTAVPGSEPDGRMHIEATLPIWTLPSILDGLTHRRERFTEHQLAHDTLLGFRLNDELRAMQFEGLLRFSLDANELMIPAPEGDVWFVLANEPANSFLDRLREAAEEVGWEASHRTAQKSVVALEFESLLKAAEQVRAELNMYSAQA